MNINPSIFREYDIRGIANKDYNAEFSYNLGRAYIKFAKQKLSKDLTIGIGKDCRTTSDEFSNALMQGIQDAGAKVIDLGMVTTPITYFSLFHKQLDGSIMVTGSHNPPEYNGFKICVGKSTIYGKDILTLKDFIESDNISFTNENRNFDSFDLIPEYYDYCLDNVKIDKKLKVVIDAGNGTAGILAPKLYEKFGCEIVELYCEPDGKFPNHEADPTVVDNLADIISKVKETKADLGIAFDGDGDRIGAVDEKGNVLFGDELLILFARDILEKNPGATVISEVKSSKKLYDDISKHNGNPIMWKTGHSLIKAKMKETKAALAGEMSGHMFFADRFFGFDDAVYAGARLLELVAKKGKKVSALLEDIPKTISTPEIRVDCSDETKFKIVEKLKELIGDEFKVLDIDGVRIDFGDSWGLVRASNTQPVLVMRFEAPTQSRLDEIKSFVETKVKAAGL